MLSKSKTAGFGQNYFKLTGFEKQPKNNKQTDIVVHYHKALKA